MKIGSVIYKEGKSIFPNSDYWYFSNPEETSQFGLIILHGGSDISPSIYNQKAIHAETGNNPTQRDERELAIAKEALRLGIPIFGICRGMQLLCALSGGTLFQHVDGHTNGHQILTSDGRVLYSNSAHHQACRLNKEGVLLATTPYVVAKKRFADKVTPEPSDEPEVEAAWWPNLNAVGIQGHPEWLTTNSPLTAYSRELVEKCLNVQLGV